MMVSLWLLLGAGVLLASLPFSGEQRFLGWPVLKSKKSTLLRLCEFLLAYALFLVLGRVFEGSLSQVSEQGWAFYAVTLLLFVVAAAPAFIWRYLWKK